ncbi:MAG: ABC transporter permease [Burkholderiales bacterium]
MKKTQNPPTSKKKFVFTNTLGILVVIIVFSLLIQTRSSEFISADNFITLMRNCSITILVGYGQMIVMAGGGLNVSIGSIGGLAAVVVGAMIQRAGLPWELAIVIAVIIGGCCGAFNGIVITRLGATGEISWLVTLATMSIFTGITLTITKANPFYNLPKGYTWIGTENIGGFLPVMIVITIVFSVLLWYMFKYTSFGRQVLAIGANQRAAALSGINVNRVIIVKHIISAVLGACAGILFSTRLGSIHSDIGGDWMLFSFAAPLIGGARMEGGRVNILGAFLGGLLLAMVSNAVVHLKVNVYIVEFLQGLIILLAVGLDRIRALREEHRERMERAKL